MLKFVGLLVVLILLCILLMRRSSGYARTKHPQLEQKEGHGGGQFHAVSIKFDADACLSAKSIQGRRYLAREAPSLPLDNCDADSCNCRFVHHDDRRSGKDRRTPFGSAGMGAVTGRFERERRQGGDRRQHKPRADGD